MKINMSAGRVVGGLLLSLGCVVAQEDGGPDYYKVKAGTNVALLKLHAEAKAGSAVIRSIPANASCLRNLGCQGGLSQKDFASLSPAERKKKAAENPRWCQVEFEGARGWVQGDALVEGPCAAAPKMVSLGGAPIAGSLQGSADHKYRFSARAGEQATIRLESRNASLYFNITEVNAQEALFNGSVAGAEFQGALPKTADYIITVYLMRNAARRNEKAAYTLHLGPKAAAAASWPAKFNATGDFRCSAGSAALDKQCTFRVVRKRGGDGTELWIVNPDAKSPVKYRMLRYAQKAFTTNDGAKATAVRQEDNWKVQVGGEHYFIPDAAIFGG